MNDGPGYKSVVTTNYNKIENLNSVDVVFTSDKSKWTRVCIVEAQENENLAIKDSTLITTRSTLGAGLWTQSQTAPRIRKMSLRQSPSVDKEGNADNSGTFGMGWFPGYAIDVETGERLTIIFSEDSWQTSENGTDMIWNPTSNIVTEEFPSYDPSAAVGTQFSGGDYLFGGKHYIYIVHGSSWVKGTEAYRSGNLKDVEQSPNYDEGAWIYEKLANSM